MTKKHCDRHDRFYYNCKNCQKAAREYAKKGNKEEGEDAIKPIPPHSDEVKRNKERYEREDKKISLFSRDEEVKKPVKKAKDERYRYVHISDQKIKINIKLIKRILLVSIPLIILILVLLSIFIIWPMWHGGISLQAQLYNSKAGGINFYDFFFLNFWSTEFFFNKTSLLIAVIGCIIMSIPPNRNLLALIGTRLRFKKPSIGKALLFWWTIGFIIFYLIGLMIGSFGDFAWVMYLYESGEIQIPITIVADAFNVLFNQNSIDIEAIFIYNGLILPIIEFIVIVFIARGVLNIFSNREIRRNDYNIITNGLLIAGLSCGLGFFILPIFALNGIHLIQIWALIILFGAFIILGIFTYIYGRSKSLKKSRNNQIKLPEAKRIVIVCGFIIIIAVIPLFLSIGPSLSLNNKSIWMDLQWNKHDARTIDWTNICAGLDIFEERTIENFTASPITNDTQIISQIRQYDQDYAVPILAAEMGTTYEGLADSDIVYINGSEYWVAPKTLKVADISGDSINTNTELYDHVEGFLALDTFSGEIVNITEAFNISEDYPIFFGEHERSYASGAYDSDILLGTGWAGGIENNEHEYEGEPDGTLYGLEAFWY